MIAKQEAERRLVLGLVGMALAMLALMVGQASRADHRVEGPDSALSRPGTAASAASIHLNPAKHAQR